MNDTLLADLQRLPILRFIMRFDKRGGTNFGACGMSEVTASRLQAAQVIDVWFYKPLAQRSLRKVHRRYRKVTAGALMPKLADLLRDELRARNLATINGIDDGHGKVAFDHDWNTRKVEVKAAALAACARMGD